MRNPWRLGRRRGTSGAVMIPRNKISLLYSFTNTTFLEETKCNPRRHLIGEEKLPNFRANKQKQATFNFIYFSGPIYLSESSQTQKRILGHSKMVSSWWVFMDMKRRWFPVYRAPAGLKKEGCSRLRSKLKPFLWVFLLLFLKFLRIVMFGYIYIFFYKLHVQI